MVISQGDIKLNLCNRISNSPCQSVLLHMSNRIMSLDVFSFIMLYVNYWHICPTDVDRCLSCIHLRSHMIGNIKKQIFFSVHNHDIFLWNSCFLCNWEAFLCKPCPVNWVRDWNCMEYCVIIESANKIWYAALMTWHFLMAFNAKHSRSVMLTWNILVLYHRHVIYILLWMDVICGLIDLI